MTITLGYWMIPLLLTIGLVWWAFRPSRDADELGTVVFAFFWLAMIPVIWCVYLGLRLWLQ